MTQFAQESVNAAGRSRRVGCLQGAKRIFSTSLIIALALVVVGFIYEHLMESGDTQRFTMPGQLVDVDGTPMHIYCVGAGSPTIVFIGGAGALSYQDRPLQEAVANNSRACVYDRAGYLWSGTRKESRTAWQIVSELHKLLVNAQEKPPYVLVGSSNGGIYARAYAYQYPAEMAGIVLVDSRIETQLGKGSTLPVWTFQGMGSIGLFRLFPNIICPENACDPKYRTEIATFRGYASNLTTYQREIDEGLDGSPEAITLLKERLGQPRSLGSIPIVILQANQAGVPLDQMPPVYRAFVDDYRTYFTNLSDNTHYELLISGHGIGVEHKGQVVEDILDVVKAARTGQPLPQQLSN